MSWAESILLICMGFMAFGIVAHITFKGDYK